MVRTLKIRFLVGLSVGALLLSGCGKDDEPAPPPPSSTGGQPTGMTDAMTQAQQALQQANGGETVKAAAPAALKEFLPAAIAGMKWTDATSESVQMGGVDMSHAEATYEADDGNVTIQITITDTGSLSGPMRMGMTGWALAQYKRETETGYERTTTYGGYKAMEEYDRETKDGALRVFVADRFVVAVDGQQTTMEAIKQAMDSVDVKKLAGLK